MPICQSQSLKKQKTGIRIPDKKLASPQPNPEVKGVQAHGLDI
jgi:hypothetical protein